MLTVAYILLFVCAAGKILPPTTGLPRGSGSWQVANKDQTPAGIEARLLLVLLTNFQTKDLLHKWMATYAFGVNMEIW